MKKLQLNLVKNHLIALIRKFEGKELLERILQNPNLLDSSSNVPHYQFEHSIAPVDYLEWRIDAFFKGTDSNYYILISDANQQVHQIPMDMVDPRLIRQIGKAAANEIRVKYNIPKIIYNA